MGLHGLQKGIRSGVTVRPRSNIVFFCFCVALTGCPGSVDDPGAPDRKEGGSAVGADQGQTDSGQTTPGETKVGDLCNLGKCSEGQLCAANICRAICNGRCGEEVPECEEGEGCHLWTSFSSICLPGTAGHLDPCGEGTICEGKLLCVTWANKPTRCLKLCQYGCPAGVSCGKTDNGCEVCVE
jgi:hypothetical protein